MPSKSKRTLQSNILPGRTFPCEEECGACLDVTRLDSKITTLQKAISELEAERVSLLSKVNHRHDVITNRLPIELLTKILELALPIPDTPVYEGSRLAILGPLVFSAVSRRWRDLVCSTPSLWAVVPIHRLYPLPLVMEELMETWISRSGQSLLSVVIDIREPHPQFLPRILNYCSHRLEYLRIKGELFPIVSRMNSSNSSPRNDAILVLTTSHDNPDMGASLKLQKGSRLATPKFEDLPSQAIVGVYASRLTHVSLRWPVEEDVIDLLVSAPMIVDLSIRGISRSRYTRENPLVIHQGLKRLRTSCYSDIMCSLLGYLTLPSLQHLDLIPFAPHATEPLSRVLLDRIVDCLRRSAAMLDYLSIQELLLDPCDEAYSSLRTLIDIVGPSIKHLVIGVRPSTAAWNLPDAPRQLIDSIFKDQKPLPFLQSITFDAIHPIWLHFLKGILVSMPRIMSGNGVQPITLTMRFGFGSSPLNTEGEERASPDMYRAGTLLPSGAEIAEMLSLREQFGVTIKMPVEHFDEGLGGSKDVSDKVLDMLTRMSREG